MKVLIRHNCGKVVIDDVTENEVNMWFASKVVKAGDLLIPVSAINTVELNYDPSRS